MQEEIPSRTENLNVEDSAQNGNLIPKSTVID